MSSQYSWRCSTFLSTRLCTTGTLRDASSTYTTGPADAHGSCVCVGGGGLEVRYSGASEMVVRSMGGAKHACVGPVHLGRPSCQRQTSTCHRNMQQHACMHTCVSANSRQLCMSQEALTHAPERRTRRA
eukprot:353166-Chlamydomonas_euryale.AAC.1